MESNNMIVAAPFHGYGVPGGRRRAAASSSSVGNAGGVSERFFTIRAADSSGVRASAGALLSERYAWRGYHTVSLPSDQTRSRMTLSAQEGDLTIGTITVSMDGPGGLSADDAFGAETAQLRAEGRRLCEFTKLAVDPEIGTTQVLAALFHVAYIVAHRLRRYDTLLLEVNPRHVRFYQRMLGCRVIGSERLNRSVNAPAVLLSADFGYIREQIAVFGGRPERASEERTLYPFAFSSPEEDGIIGRMMRELPAGSSQVN